MSDHRYSFVGKVTSISTGMDKANVVIGHDPRWTVEVNILKVLSAPSPAKQNEFIKYGVHSPVKLFALSHESIVGKSFIFSGNLINSDHDLQVNQCE